MLFRSTPAIQPFQIIISQSHLSRYSLTHALSNAMPPSAPPVCDSVLGALSQLFFLDRATTLIRLSRRPYAPIVLPIVSLPSILAGFILGIVSGVLPFAFDPANAQENYALLSRTVIRWKSVTVGVDVVLTGTSESPQTPPWPGGDDGPI